MPPVEHEPATRSEPTYGMTRQQRDDEQEAIWKEAARHDGGIRRRLRNELGALALVALAATGGILYFVYW